MGIYKTTDPDGINPDVYTITIDDDDPNLTEAFLLLLETNSYQGRINLFRQKYPHLENEANDLQRKLDNPRENRDYWEMMAMSILAAEENAIKESMRPKIQRDNKRQDGTRKPRNPEINSWIERQLRVAPDLKSPELWQRAPDYITDIISVDRFKKRVTEVRKKIRCAANN